MQKKEVCEESELAIEQFCLAQHSLEEPRSLLGSATMSNMPSAHSMFCWYQLELPGTV